MRITSAQRMSLLLQVDSAIDKLNDDRNKNKPHWSKMTHEQIQRYIAVECSELSLALLSEPITRNIELSEEYKDVLLLALFGLDNLSTTPNLHKHFIQNTN